MSATPFPRVIVEPDDGVQPVAELIGSAAGSLLIKQFSFDEDALLGAVEERARAGVAVRVMLNPQRSSGSRANDVTMARLREAGIAARWSSPRFAVTHEKSIVVDRQVALVATFNLCEKYFTQTRDYGVLIDDRQQVDEIATVFEADWAGEAWSPAGASELLWSSSNSRRRMADFIDGARHRLDVQHPKFVDAVILDRLVEAADRGVHVRILCGGKHGISDYDVLDTFASLRLLARHGIRVNKQKGLRLHAKLLLADKERALVGSMNIDRSAFDLRRELGIVLRDRAAVRSLRRVFMADWEASERYHPPDPLVAFRHEEHDFAHDGDLAHE